MLISHSGDFVEFNCDEFKRETGLEFGLMVKENILGFELGFGA